MPTVLRDSGFDFKINTDDHEPMHVHIWHQGNLLILNFDKEIKIRNNYGFNNNEARRAVRITEPIVFTKKMEGNTRMKDFDQQFKEATENGRSILAVSSAAEKASYNVESKRLVIELKNGVTALIPVNLIQILENASAEQISDVEVAVSGLYLRWKGLDEDLFVPNLLQGIFGTHKWMNSLHQHLSAIGAKGGSIKSEAKTKSARENGKKGGRPGKKHIA